MSRKKNRKAEENTRQKRKYNTKELDFTGWHPCHPWADYAEDFNPFLFLGPRSETGSGWLEVGCDAGDYCSKTRDDCEAGVPSTCEPGDTAELAVLGWLPHIFSHLSAYQLLEKRVTVEFVIFEHQLSKKLIEMETFLKNESVFQRNHYIFLERLNVS